MGDSPGAPVPENAFARTEDTRGRASSIRHAYCCQLGGMISDPLSRPARSKATTADGSHHMRNKLSFLVFNPSPMI